ncbi:MAG: S9 family peptidase [Armatimonadetes bacterium]|nr:S9 family peptidase [Armatimonadota bacterium]MDW8121545.1 S9 family peptidase [Armatimonadota bacterium]
MEKQKVTAEDLLELKLIGDPQVSPDGQRCVFTVKTVDREKNRYLSHLWMADLKNGEVRPFTFGEVADGQPRWSPDATKIAFVRTQLKEKRSQIWLIRSDGGEAWTLTNLDEGSIGELTWSPDGSQIAFTFRPTDPNWTQEARKKREEKGLSNPPRVITRLHYRLDGVGFLDQRQHIWICDVATGAARPITNGDYDDSNPDFSPDGRFLVFVSNRSEDPEERPYEVDLWLVPVEGGEIKKVPTPTGYKGLPAFSPNGRWIAFIGHESRDDPWVPRNDKVWIVNPHTEEVRCLTAELDRDIGNDTLSDCREAFTGGGKPIWSSDSRLIFFTVSDAGSCQVYCADTDGNWRPVTEGPHDIYGFSLDRSANVLVVAQSTPTAPGELFTGELTTDSAVSTITLRPLTHLNGRWLQQRLLSEPEEVWFDSFDGTKIQGWLLKPPDFDQNQRYPLLLYIHGGPHAQYGWTFFHEFQWHAANGYIVFYTNPRGSLGFAESFAAAIRGNWGEMDFKDVMAAADFAQSLPYVDPQRMAVAGGSYGGYMTNWIIGHTNRFCCAVTDRSVVNLHSMAGTSDFPLHPDGYWEGNAWDRPDKLWVQSPLRYVGNVQTPVLIIHSEGDLRCPIGQAEELFAALRRLKKQVIFVRYPAETSHGLSRSGPPDLRIDRLRRIGEFIDTCCAITSEKEKPDAD